MIIQRAWIKETAKFRFKQRYGMCVGAALLFLLLADDTNSEKRQEERDMDAAAW
jgi:hypothetical protein